MKAKEIEKALKTFHVGAERFMSDWVLVVGKKISEPHPMPNLIEKAWPFLSKQIAEHLAQATKEKTVIHPAAKEVLAYLSKKTGKEFRETKGNLESISCRLLEAGVDSDGLKAMIDRQCELWMGTRMQEYLRPSTLFKWQSKFEAYYAARNTPVELSDRKRVSYSENI